MGVEIVHHDPNHVCGWEPFVYQGLHLTSKVLLCPMLGHMNVSQAHLGCHHHEQVAGTVARIFVVDAPGSSWRYGHRRTGFPNQLIGHSSKQTNGRFGSSGSAYRSRMSSMCHTNSGPTVEWPTLVSARLNVPFLAPGALSRTKSGP